MNSNSSILGIPVPLIAFAVINALIVLTPVVLLQGAVMDQLNAKPDKTDVQTYVRAVVPTAEPTATPSAVLTPVVTPTLPVGRVATPTVRAGQLR